MSIKINASPKPLNEKIYEFIRSFDNGASRPDIIATFEGVTTASSISGILHGLEDEDRIYRPKRGYYRVLDSNSRTFARKTDPRELVIEKINKIKADYSLNLSDLGKLSDDQLMNLKSISNILDEAIEKLS